MDMEEIVRRKIRLGRGNLTTERIASSLRTDIRTVKKTISEMLRTGEVTLTSWERVLRMEK